MKTLLNFVENLEYHERMDGATDRDKAMAVLVGLYDLRPRAVKHLQQMQRDMNAPKDMLWHVRHKYLAEGIRRREKSLKWLDNEIKRLSYKVATLKF